MKKALLLFGALLIFSLSGCSIARDYMPKGPVMILEQYDIRMTPSNAVYTSVIPSDYTLIMPLLPLGSKVLDGLSFKK